MLSSIENTPGLSLNDSPSHVAHDLLRFVGTCGDDNTKLESDYSGVMVEAVIAAVTAVTALGSTERTRPGSEGHNDGFWSVPKHSEEFDAIGSP